VYDVAIDSLGLSFGAAAHGNQSGLALAYGSMPKKSPKRDLRGSKLTAATAEAVFGWKNVHKHDGDLVGKKQDKLGRWRLAKVPNYSNDPTQAYAIDERMKELGQWDQYTKELSRLTARADRVIK
jgi:hypothetical protein